MMCREDGVLMNHISITVSPTDSPKRLRQNTAHIDGETERVADRLNCRLMTRGASKSTSPTVFHRRTSSLSYTHWAFSLCKYSDNLDKYWLRCS